MLVCILENHSSCYQEHSTIKKKVNQPDDLSLLPSLNVSVVIHHFRKGPTPTVTSRQRYGEFAANTACDFQGDFKKGPASYDFTYMQARKLKATNKHDKLAETHGRRQQFSDY